MRIVIIGTGNTATVLGKLFQKAGHTIIQVFGRTGQQTEELAAFFHTSFTIDQKQLNPTADIYLVAVSDNAIGAISSWLRVGNKLVVHTAGSVESAMLACCSKNYGVLYPLQSLRKETDYLPEIPFLVTGNTQESSTLIFDFAKTVSEQVELADDNKRRMCHIAAIMAGNFINHLYVAAEDFCKKEKIDFRMLLPLITETAGRLNKFLPGQVQTGPAMRNDTTTIEKHISLLESFPWQQSIYKYFTQSIQQWYNSKI